jgi:pimeloyl-ACP methyl ester carboxylesterase
MDRLGLERASLGGVSMGAMVAMWVGAHAPGRVERLVLCCTSAHMDGSAWAERAAVVRAAGSTEPIADAVVERWTTPGHALAHPEVRAWLRGMLVGTDAEGTPPAAARSSAWTCAAISIDQRSHAGHRGAGRCSHTARAPAGHRRRHPRGAARAHRRRSASGGRRAPGLRSTG